eukprot:jgi/Orpsp1_1/1174743/evm.model.c7180000051232.1
MLNYYLLLIVVIIFNYFIGASAKSSIYYDLDAIKKETNWTDVSVQEFETLNHLSLISQSPYFYKDRKIDPNYYYPSTAGQGMIFISLISVLFWIMRISKTSGNEKINCVNVAGENQAHGTMAASVAAGNISGVAKKANIHFLASDNTTEAHKACADFIVENAKSGKTVVSISSAGYVYHEEDKNLLETLTNNGFIVIVSADNENRNSCAKGDTNANFVSYPGYGIAITVGAVNTTIYDDGYRKEEYSNYGNCVDVFAPGDVTMADTENGKNMYKGSFGTSCSTPLVAGMAALIMAEHPDVKFDQVSMKQKLIDMSIKDAITDVKFLGSMDTPNRFVNNGKLSIYSPADVNIECGISPDGEDHSFCDVCLIENGCQNDFGRCYTKEESVSECEKLLKDKENCLVQPDASNFEKTCPSFNLPYCQDFYKVLYAEQSPCSIAKKDESNKSRASLEFIYNFTKEKYNEWNDLCTEDLQYHEDRYKNMFGECTIKNIQNKYNTEYSTILNHHERLRYNKCYEVYYNSDRLAKMIKNNHSCSYLKEKKSMDYVLNNVIQVEKYKNFLHDYIEKVYKKYEPCIVDESMSESELKTTCGDINCPYLYRKDIFKKYIPTNYKYLDEEDIKLVKKIGNNKENYVDTCRKYLKKVNVEGEDYYPCIFKEDVNFSSTQNKWSYENNEWCYIDPNKKT